MGNIFWADKIGRRNRRKIKKIVLKRELEPKTTGARVYNLTTRETMRRNRRKIKKKSEVEIEEKYKN